MHGLERGDGSVEATINTAAPNPGSCAQGLQALRGAGCHCLDGPASLMGATSVTGEQVLVALVAATPDGPLAQMVYTTAEIYQRLAGKFAAILAAVLSEEGSMGNLPQGLRDGMIVYFYKAGYPTAPAKYRPKALLNMDYRTFAGVPAGTKHLSPLPGLPQDTRFLAVAL